MGFALALIGLGFLPRMYVEFRRHALQLTPSDLLMIIGLFALGPWLFIAIGMLAEAVAALRHRQAPLKTVFILVHLLGGLVAAATVFAVLGRTDPLDPVAWLAAATALAACALWDWLSTSAVLSIAEGSTFRAVFSRILPAIVAGWVASALLGIAALVLFHGTPFGPLLFAPVLAILVVSTRGVARQQAERAHFERLYDASSNLTELVGLHDMLGRVATEARSMTTAAAAVCCTAGPEDAPLAVIADDHGTRPAPQSLVDILTTVTAHGSSGQLDEAGLEQVVGAGFLRYRGMVWAAKCAEGTAPLQLTVFRELPIDDDRQPEIPTAFVSHAAALVTNVGLHAEVRDALGKQVELNRLKSEFAAAVSDELRTPLATMISSVQTVRRLDDRSRRLPTARRGPGRAPRRPAAHLASTSPRPDDRVAPGSGCSCPGSWRGDSGAAWCSSRPPHLPRVGAASSSDSRPRLTPSVPASSAPAPSGIEAAPDGASRGSLRRRPVDLAPGPITPATAMCTTTSGSAEGLDP